MTPTTARAIETLRAFVLADIALRSRRMRSSDGRRVRLRVSPIALSETDWNLVAQHILERRPNWRSVELVDVRGRVVGACERHALGE